MKKTFLISALSATLALSSCSFVSQVANPLPPRGYMAPTGELSVDRNDCRVICAQAMGQSKGFSLLGLIPIKQPSETAAIKNMYDNAQRRGAKIEGESAYFANRAIERSSNYYVLWSRPTIKASGDLIQYLPGARSKQSN